MSLTVPHVPLTAAVFAPAAAIAADSTPCPFYTLPHHGLQYVEGKGKLSVGDVLIQIASERGHKTILEEDRSERLSESEGEGTAAAAAGGSSSGAEPGDSNGSNSSSSAKASNVTSFAVDDFSDSEEVSEDGAPRSSISGSEGGRSSTAAEEQQQQEKTASAVAAATAATAAAAGVHGHHKHSHKKHHHHHHHKAVGLMLDVSQHGHVSVVLVPGEL